MSTFRLDPAVAVSVIRRLDAGWELFDVDGRCAWYKQTKPGFDEELPTQDEVELIMRVRLGHEPEGLR